MGADNQDGQKTADPIKFRYDDKTWIDIGMVSIIVRNFIQSGMVPESKMLAQKYPDLASRMDPVCYFDIDRKGKYAEEMIAKGKSPGRIGISYMRGAQTALKEFAKWLRANPDSEFSKSKYIVGVSRIASKELADALGFDIFEDAEVDADIPHHSVEMAEDFYAKSGMEVEDAKERTAKHKISIAVMPIQRLLEKY